MLINGSKLIETPVLSLQAGGPVAWTRKAIIDPDNLKILGFLVHGPLVDGKDEHVLDIKSVREFSQYGMVIDSIEEIVSEDDVVKIAKILKLKFDLIGLKVETKKKSRLGKVSGFTCTENDFIIQQLIVQRPALKSFFDSELTIPRSEIVEINDYKVIVKDEEKKIKERLEHEDFIPNFVNPFRKNPDPEPEYAPAQSQNPDEQDN